MYEDESAPVTLIRLLQSGGYQNPNYLPRGRRPDTRSHSLIGEIASNVNGGLLDRELMLTR